MTAVAADQPPERPRFIALLPGCLGSVIVDEFLEVANSSKVLPPSSHGVEHFIAMKGPPIASKFWRLDAEKLQAAKAEFEQLERGDCAAFHLSMGQPSAHGDEEGRDVGAMWRHPPPQPGHGAGYVPSAEHAGFFCQGARSLAKLILEKVIIKYLCTQLTSGRQPSAHHSGCSSFAACLSGCATRATPSSA